jgi:hypothetical protein
MPWATPVERPGERGPAFALGLLALACAALAYGPITGLYFQRDDFLHLYQLANWPLPKLLVEPFGGHLYFLRNLVLAGLHQAFGTEPRGYFVVGLLTHLANVGLLYLLLLRLTGGARLACGAAVLWGTSPVLEGTLGWYSVHGSALVATVLLAVLFDASGSAGSRPSGGRLAVWSLALVLGAGCFGTGIALALCFPLVAGLWLPPGPQRGRAVLALAPLWLVVPSLYLLCGWIWRTVYAEPGYPLAMQLAIALDWRAPLATLAGLLAYGVAGLHLGFFWPGRGGPRLLLWGVCVLAVAAVGVALARAPVLRRRRVLGCLLLALAIYGLIAAARGNLYLMAGAGEGWSVTPFTLGAEKRYHYVGLLPLLLGSCLSLSALSERWRLSPRTRSALLAAVLAALAVGQQISGWQIDRATSARARRQTARVLAEIRAAIAATPPGQDVRLVARRFPPVGPPIGADRFPGWAGVFAIFFPENRVDGHRIYFVTADPAVLAAARGGRRSQELLRSAESRPGSSMRPETRTPRPAPR